MDYTVGDTIYFKFTTRAFATGIPTTLAGSPVLSVYEDASVTQITAGVSITADLDSVAGLNLATIVATGGNGFETGKHYAVVITTGTVSAVSVVGEVIGQFTLEKSAAAIDLANATDGLGAIKTDTGTTIPDLISGIGTAGGSSISVDAATSNQGGGITGVTSGTTIVGTPTNTYTSTSVLDGVYHIITHATNAIDIVYQFLTGGGTSPVSVVWTGYLTSANDIVTMSAWNHVGGARETLTFISGTGGTSNSVINPILYARHRGTSAAELGKVYIRLHCTAQTSPVLNTDQIFIEYAVTSRSVGYSGGAVWVDTVNGVAGTESFVNGVADNQVDTIASAITIASNVGLFQYHIANGSTITLSQTSDNDVFYGHEWTLALNSQSVASTMFIDAEVTGTGTGANAEFEDCIFGITSLPAMQAYNCSFTATTSGGFTMSAAGDYRFINCQSGVAGSGAPLFTLGTGAITAEFRRWSGGISLTGITADDVLTISGELGTVNLGSPSGGNIEIRGTYKAITNAGSATVNIDGAILGGDVASVKAKTDSLTFTTAGEVDANIQSVNDIVVTGNGETGTEWGPV